MPDISDNTPVATDGGTHDEERENYGCKSTRHDKRLAVSLALRQNQARLDDCRVLLEHSLGDMNSENRRKRDKSIAIVKKVVLPCLGEAVSKSSKAITEVDTIRASSYVHRTNKALANQAIQERDLRKAERMKPPAQRCVEHYLREMEVAAKLAAPPTPRTAANPTAARNTHSCQEPQLPPAMTKVCFQQYLPLVEVQRYLFQTLNR